jgi:hypothetical protein
VELAGSASLDTDEQSDQLLHSGSMHWGCWVHYPSWEHCWALPDVVLDCQSAARDAGCHTITGIEDIVGSDYVEGTSHGSTNWVALGSFAENPVGDKHAGECCS